MKKQKLVFEKEDIFDLNFEQMDKIVGGDAGTSFDPCTEAKTNCNSISGRLTRVYTCCGVSVTCPPPPEQG